MTAPVYLKNCRGCGYPVPPDERCPECGMTNVALTSLERLRRPASLRRDARLIIASELAQPVMIICLVLAMILMSLFEAPDDRVMRSIGVLVALCPLVLLIRAAATRLGGVLPLWTHALVFVSSAFCAWVLALAFFDNAPERAPAFTSFILVLCSLAVEQYLLARLFGTPRARQRSEITIGVAAVWSISLPLMYVIESWFSLDFTRVGERLWMIAAGAIVYGLWVVGLDLWRSASRLHVVELPETPEDFEP